MQGPCTKVYLYCGAQSITGGRHGGELGPQRAKNCCIKSGILYLLDAYTWYSCDLTYPVQSCQIFMSGGQHMLYIIFLWILYYFAFVGGEGEGNCKMAKYCSSLFSACVYKHIVVA